MWKYLDRTVIHVASASWPIDLVASVVHCLALSSPEGFTLSLNCAAAFGLFSNVS